ncbi:MAG TPA: GNAT family N-acetyltransferase, partial [Thermoplasmata archaeon]|nr:GNAT family N-acetyltransferase [Thermoplasmata archaeon]
IACGEDSRPVGQARFEAQGESLVISVGTAPAARGKGYGSEIILMGSLLALRETGAGSVIAFLRPENERSHRAFAAANFKEVSEEVVKGVRALKMAARREDLLD